MRTRTMLAGALALGTMLVACGQRDEEGNYVPQEGRKETESLQNVDVVGYGGVRKKVDKALDTNDQRVDQLNQELEKQER